jgi:hypothetical protein
MIATWNAIGTHKIKKENKPPFGSFGFSSPAHHNDCNKYRDEEERNTES